MRRMKKFLGMLLCVAVAAALIGAAPANTSDGWHKSDSETWTYIQNGKNVTGWVKVGGTWYYMNEDGVMQTGWQKESASETYYYFDKSGAMVTGHQVIDGVEYIFNSDGTLVV